MFFRNGFKSKFFAISFLKYTRIVEPESSLTVSISNIKVIVVPGYADMGSVSMFIIIAEISGVTLSLIISSTGVKAPQHVLFAFTMVPTESPVP